MIDALATPAFLAAMPLKMTPNALLQLQA